MTPRQKLIGEARRLRGAGWTDAMIGNQVGYSAAVVRIWLGSADAPKKRAYHGVRRSAGIEEARSAAVVDTEARQRLAQIPPDTRTLTGRLLGDPLPGRSALETARGRG